MSNFCIFVYCRYCNIILVAYIYANVKNNLSDNILNNMNIYIRAVCFMFFKTINIMTNPQIVVWPYDSPVNTNFIFTFVLILIVLILSSIPRIIQFRYTCRIPTWYMSNSNITNTQHRISPDGIVKNLTTILIFFLKLIDFSWSLCIEHLFCL